MKYFALKLIQGGAQGGSTPAPLFPSQPGTLFNTGRKPRTGAKQSLFSPVNGKNVEQISLTCSLEVERAWAYRARAYRAQAVRDGVIEP